MAHCHPVNDMADGYHTLSAKVSDLAGNWSEDASLRFTVDTIPPTITIDSPEDQLLTNQPEIPLEGRLSEWATLEVNRIDVAIDNNHAFATSELMVEGQNDFLFHAVDRATNESKENRTVYLDTVPPVITIDSHENGEFTAEKRHTIHGHVSEPVTLILQGEEIPVSEGALEFSLTRELQPGDNLFSFQAVDLAGNTSSANLQIIYLDQPPAPIDPVLISLDFDNAGNAIYFGPPGSLSPGSHLVLEPVYDENGNEVLILPINIFPELDGSFQFTLPPNVDYRVYVEDAVGRRSEPMLISDLADAPKQGKLVGALRGELSVDPNGTANYRIPIKVPKGAGGMQPELALLYSSAAGNGQFGMGWSLSGLSAITRCPQTLQNDDAIRRVMHDAGDRLCLDGQRLLPHNGWNGSYLAPGRRFITERASFQRIRSYGGDQDTGPAGFTVEDKAGLTRYYGNYGSGPDGRIETDGTNTAMLWMISSIHDKHGNHIDFRYDYERGEYWPSEINWYNAAGLHVGKIAFNAEAEIRPDKQLGALTDRTRRPMTRRINRITSYAGTNTGISPVRRININYEQGTFSKRSRIRSLELCGREGSGWKCVPETQFAWRDRANPDNYGRIWSEKKLDRRVFGQVSSLSYVQFVDINNDGLQDAVWWADNDNEILETPDDAEFSKPLYLWVHINGSLEYKRLPITAYSKNAAKNYALFDANQDGYLDIAAVTQRWDRYEIHRWKPDQDTFETTPWKTFSGLFDAEGGGFRPTPIDVDGDGIQELLYKRGTVHGNTHAITIRWFDGSGRVENTNWGVRRDQAIRPIEFNGDGLPDLLVDTRDCSASPNTETLHTAPDDQQEDVVEDSGGESGSSWRGCESTSGILINQGDGTFTDNWHLAYTPPVCLPGSCNNLPGDGGGYCDPQTGICYHPKSTDPYHFPCIGEDVSNCQGFGRNFLADRPLVTDFNGDGLTDIVTYDSGTTTWKLWLNSGGFYALKASWKGTHVSDGEVSSSVMGDVNLDGIPDLIFADEANFYVKMMTPDGFSSAPHQFVETQENSRFMDIDSDGDIDMLLKYDDWWVRTNTGTRIDLLAGVKLGTNEALEIAYQPLASLVRTNGKLPYLGHLSAGESEKPLTQHRNVLPPMDVVSAIAVDTGTEKRIATYYSYRGLKIDAKRGFLGFKEVRAHNENSGITTVNIHRQSWPYTGQVAESYQFVPQRTQQQVRNTSLIHRDMNLGCFEERLNCQLEAATAPRESLTAASREHLDAEATGHKITHTINNLAKRTSAQGAVQVYIGNSDSTSRDYHSGNILKLEKTTFTYDGYGNAETIVHEVSDNNGANKHTTVTENTYANWTSNWILGRLTHSRVSQTWKGSTRLTTSEFSYDPIHGQLTSEAVTSGNQSETLTTDYEHDAFGNVISKRVRGWDGTSQKTRTTATLFEPTGRYPESVSNDLGHTETYEWNFQLGKKKSVTGPNDLTTHYQYDPLGRLTGTIAPRTAVVETITRNWCVTSTASCQDEQAIWVVSKSLSSGQDVITEYDRLGREVRVRTETYPSGWVNVEKRYDLRGRLVAETSPHKTGINRCWTLYEYDNIDRPIGVYSPADVGQCGLISGLPTQQAMGTLINLVKFSYNVTRSVYADHVTYQRDAEGRITARRESASGLLLNVSERVPGDLSQNSLPGVLQLDGRNMVTHYQYDARGNTTQVTDPAGNRVHMSYDARDRKIAMRDPDMGNWQYHYNAFGELIGQQDAKGNSVSMQYDVLGRMIERHDADGSTTWEYDTAPGKGTGKLARVIQRGAAGSITVAEAHQYTGYGELAATARVLEGRVYRTRHVRDGFGRIRQINYPGTGIETTGSPETVAPTGSITGEPFAVAYDYDNRTGQLQQVRATDDSVTYWRLVGTDSAGRIKSVQTGSGLHIENDQDLATGALERRQVTGSTDPAARLDQQYQWDRVGNLTWRKDTVHSVLGFADRQDLTETYTYDALYRLKTVNMNWHRGMQQFASGQVMNHRYDAIGNIKSQNEGKNGGVTAYDYGNNAGPHAVTSVNVHGVNKSYDYDANGNLTTASWSGSTRTVTWTSFNKPARITKGSSFSAFAYGPDRMRYKHVRHGPDASDPAGTMRTTTTWYVGDLYEQIDHGTRTTHRYNIRVGNQVVAVKEHETAKADVAGTLLQHRMRYFYRDHLGSVVMVTDATGQLLERASYSPWGQRKDMSALTDYAQVGAGSAFTNLPRFHRGFTGHETLEHLGLVHMNGRIYDPEIGRFLSADPFVQFPESTQGFNRYAYVGNNPLTLTDPSGYFSWRKALAALSAAPLGIVGMAWAYDNASTVGKIHSSVSGFLNLVPGCQVWCAAVASTAGAYMQGANAHGAARAGAFSAAGSAIGIGAAQVGGIGGAFIAGVGGGALSKAGGGRFGDGFLGSFAGSLAASSGIGNTGNIGGDMFVGAIVGGTVAKIGGGKFANGAVSGAMAAAFGNMQRSSQSEGLQTGGRTLTAEEAKSALTKLQDELGVSPGALIEGENGAVSYSPTDVVKIYRALDKLATEQGYNFLRDRGFGPERTMLARVILGKGDEYTVSWFHHERAEAGLLQNSMHMTGQNYRTAQINAHNDVLRYQGNSSINLYHPSVVRAYDDQFGRAFPRY
jgi:RHS repeat-associated protein